MTRRSSPHSWLSRRNARLLFAVVAALVAVVFSATAKRLPPTEGIVSRAIDGDTVQLADGRHVRYIGIDTPELRRFEGGRWRLDPEPYAAAAAEANRALVEGKRVRLEFDADPADRYGRALAYVYVDETMVNERLLADGYAELLTVRPNVRYLDRFKRAETEARQERRGVWSGQRF